LPQEYRTQRLGYRKGLDSFRDKTPESEDIAALMIKAGTVEDTGKGKQQRKLKGATAGTLPANYNVVEHFTTIEDQGDLGSCTANAGVGLFEYYYKRFKGVTLDMSRIFLYKMTRYLMRQEGVGDSGAYMRTTMEAMRMYGVCHEWECPYNIPDFDNELKSPVFASASNFQGIKYFRLDKSGGPQDIINRVKEYLNKGFPSFVGFTCYESLFDQNVGDTGEIPWPASNERVIGGHAVVFAGWSDNKQITNSRNGQKTKGAFLIRNSWGEGWASNNELGFKGYGWLPYDYILNEQADDIWTLISAEFVDPTYFQ
jgi:C1A family cysteine protease